jgi:hypothetical protein
MSEWPKLEMRMRMTYSVAGEIVVVVMRAEARRLGARHPCNLELAISIGSEHHVSMAL